MLSPDLATPRLDVPRVGASPDAPDLYHGLAALSAALLVLMALWAFSGEARTVNGVPVWLKPAKFSLSFVVLFGTIALVRDRLSPAVRDGWPLRLVGWGMAAAVITEVAWVVHQAARGTGSHFNLATPFEAFMYTTVMAAGAVYLVAAIGAIGWIAWRDRAAAMGPGLREGVWLGFLASFLLTLVVAGVMSSGTGPHVGVHPDGAPVLPLLGWSGVTGDLRPAHFLALHAMQALPLLGLWLDRGRTDADGGASTVRTVRVAALIWTALTLAAFAQAMAGMPLIPLGAG